MLPDDEHDHIFPPAEEDPLFSVQPCIICDWPFVRNADGNLYLHIPREV